MEDYPVDSIHPATSEVVYTTHATASGQFYVHVDSQSNILDDIMEKLAKRYMDLNSSDKLLHLKKPGALCAAKFVEDDNWYRAKITGVIKNDLIEVHFVDYGNTDYVNVDCIKALDADLILYPVRSYKCVLAGVSCDRGFWTPEVMVQFEDLVLDKKCQAVFRGKLDDDETYLIDMYDENGRYINELFGATSAANGFTDMDIKVGDTMQVSVVYWENPSNFWCQENDSVNNILMLSEELSRLHMTQELKPLQRCTQGAVCAAKFSEDESWYRGIVQSVSGNVAEVNFVDYGNTEKVVLQHVTNLKPEMRKLPAAAIRCCLSGIGLKNWPKELIDVFETLIREKELEMHIVGKKGSLYEVTLLDILENTDIGSQLKPFIDRFRSTPEQVPKKETSGELDQRPLTVGSKVDVIVSWTESPGDFWVQRVDTENLLDDLSNKLQEHYSKPQPAAPSTPGAVVVARYSEDQMWYRGIVLKELDDGRAQVLFLDYGNSDILPKEELRQVTGYFGELIPLAVRCCLWGVKPLRKGDKSWNNDAKDFLEKLTENGAVCEVVNETNTHKHVRLIAGNKDVAKELLALNVVSDAQGPSTNSVLNTGYTNKIQLNKSQREKVTVSHVDSVKSFWCLLVKFTDSLNELMDKLNLHYSDRGGTAVREPTVGQACISPYSEDDNWYRGCITQVSQDRCEVQFVDYGNRERVASNLICIPEPRFLDIPTQAIHCCLPFNENVDHLTDLFTDLVLDKDLQLEVKDVMNDIFVIELYNGNQPISSQLRNLSFNKQSSPAPSLPVSSQIVPARTLPLQVSVKVYASFSVSPCKFFIQRADSEEELASLMERIAEAYACDNQQTAVKNPQAGQSCVGLYSEDNQWYRGRILSLSGSTCNVLFVDYGNEEAINIKNIRNILPELAKIPTMAYQCSLIDVEDITWSPAAIEYFESLIMDQELEGTFVSPTSVKLMRDGDDIVSLLVKAGHCKKNNASDGWDEPAKSASESSVGFSHLNNKGAKDRKFNSGLREEPNKFGGQQSGRFSDGNSRRGFNDLADNRSFNRREERSSCSSSDKESVFNDNKSSFGSFDKSNQRRQGGDGDSRRDGGFRNKNTDSSSPGELVYPTPPSEMEPAILIHMDDDGTFYLQLPSMEKDIVFLSKRLASSYKTGGPRLRDEIKKKGVICCTKFSGDGCFYRSRVEEILGNKVVVRYIDYGNTSECSIQDLKFLFPDLLQLPVLAFPCHLRGFSWSVDKIEKFLEATLDKNIMVTFTSFTHPYEVDISTPDGDLLGLLTGQSCPTTLKPSPSPTLDTHHITPFSSRSPPQVSSSRSPTKVNCLIPKQEFPQQASLKGIYTAYITHVTEDGFFYLQLEKDSSVMEDISDKLSNVTNNLKHPCVKTGASCGAIFSEDSSWYRALVTGVSGGKIQVHFVDYGNGDIVNPSDVIPLSNELLAVPPLAYKCLFEDSEAMGSEAQAKLADYLMEHKMTAEFLGGKDPATVKLLTEDGQDLKEIICPSSNYRSQSTPSENIPASVSYIEEDGRIFIQLYKEQGAIAELCESLSQFYNSQTVSELEQLEVGMPCCVSDEENNWFRGKVKQVEDLMASVLQVDYGKVVSVDKNHLRKLQPQFLKKPPFAWECNLNGVESWTGDLKAKLAAITDGKIFNATFHTKTAPFKISLTRSIELDLLELTSNVTSATDQQKQSKLLESKSSADISEVQKKDSTQDSLISPNMPKDDEKMEETRPETLVTNLEVGQRVSVTVSFVLSPDKFYFHLNETRSALDILMDEMFEYFSSAEENELFVKNFSVGQLCAALYSDESWYRVRIESLLGDSTYQVFYIDHGNSESADVSTLRVLPDKFKAFAPWAIEGKLGGVVPLGDSWAEEALEEFKIMVEEKSLLADIIAIEHSLYSVHLLELGISIHETLFRKGYAALSSETMVSKTVQQVFSDANDSMVNSFLESTHVEGDEKTAEQMMSTGAHAQQKIRCISDSLEALQETSVYVSHSTTPSFFWCQLASSTETLSQISESLASLYSSPQADDIIHGSPNAGDIVVALYTEDDQYYRAEVMCSNTIDELETDKISVRFIDYGNTSDSPKEQIYKINEELCQYPAQAFSCCLDHLKPDNDVWSPEACSKFSELVDNKEFALKLVGKDHNGTLIVELMHPDSHEQLATQLVAEGFGKISSTEPLLNMVDSVTADSRICDTSECLEMNPIMESTAMAGETVPSSLDSYTLEEPENGHYRHLRLTQHTEYDVTVTNDELPNCFYVQLVNLKNQYSSLMVEIAEHVISDSSHNTVLFVPEAGTSCLVQQYGIWYRGEIIKQETEEQESWIVRSVDLGWEASVGINDLKPLPSQFQTLPSQAVPCYLAGIVSVNVEWSADAVAFFRDSIKNRKLNMSVLEHGDDGKFGVYLFDLDDTSVQSVNRAMVEMGFAEVVPGSNIDVDIQMEKTLDTDMLNELEESFNEVSILKCNDVGDLEEGGEIMTELKHFGNVEDTEDQLYLAVADDKTTELDEFATTLSGVEPGQDELHVKWSDHDKSDSFDDSTEAEGNWDTSNFLEYSKLLVLLDTMRKRWVEISDDMEEFNHRISKMKSIPVTLLNQIIFSFDHLKSDLVFATQQVCEVETVLYLKSKKDECLLSSSCTDDDDDTQYCSYYSSNDSDTSLITLDKTGTVDETIYGESLLSKRHWETHLPGSQESIDVNFNNLSLETVLNKLSEAVIDTEQLTSQESNIYSEMLPEQVSKFLDAQEEKQDLICPVILDKASSLDNTDLVTCSSGKSIPNKDVDKKGKASDLSVTKEETIEIVTSDLSIYNEVILETLTSDLSACNDVIIETTNDLVDQCPQVCSLDESYAYSTYAKDSSNYDTSSLVFSDTSVDVASFDLSTDVDTSMSYKLDNESSCLTSVFNASTSNACSTLASDTSNVGSLVSSEMSQMSVAGTSLLASPSAAPSQDSSSSSYTTSSATYNVTTPSSSVDSIANGFLEVNNAVNESNSSPDKTTDELESTGDSHGSVGIEMLVNYDADAEDVGACEGSSSNGSMSDLSELTDSPDALPLYSYTDDLVAKDNLTDLTSHQLTNPPVLQNVLSSCPINDQSDDSGPPSFHEDAEETPRVSDEPAPCPPNSDIPADVEDFYQLDLGLEDPQAEEENLSVEDKGVNKCQANVAIQENISSLTDDDKKYAYLQDEVDCPENVLTVVNMENRSDVEHPQVEVISENILSMVDDNDNNKSDEDIKAEVEQEENIACLVDDKGDNKSDSEHPQAVVDSEENTVSVVDEKGDNSDTEHPQAVVDSEENTVSVVDEKGDNSDTEHPQAVVDSEENTVSVVDEKGDNSDTEHPQAVVDSEENTVSVVDEKGDNSDTEHPQAVVDSEENTVSVVDEKGDNSDTEHPQAVVDSEENTVSVVDEKGDNSDTEHPQAVVDSEENTVSVVDEKGDNSDTEHPQAVVDSEENTVSVVDEKGDNSDTEHPQAEVDNEENTVSVVDDRGDNKSGDDPSAPTEVNVNAGDCFLKTGSENSEPSC